MDDDAIDRLARSLSPTLAAPRLETLRSAPPVDPERADDLAQWMERHGLTVAEAEAVCMRALAFHQAEIDESATAFGRDEWWAANRAILWVQERSLRAVAAAYARDGRAFSDLFGMDVDVLRAGGDLAAECRAARVIAHGRPAGAGDVREISAAEWCAGLAFYTSNAGRLYLAYPPGAGPAFTDVVFDRRSLFAAFEPLAERAAIRPGVPCFPAATVNELTAFIAERGEIGFGDIAGATRAIGAPPPDARVVDVVAAQTPVKKRGAPRKAADRIEAAMKRLDGEGHAVYEMGAKPLAKLIREKCGFDAKPDTVRRVLRAHNSPN